MMFNFDDPRRKCTSGPALRLIAIASLGTLLALAPLGLAPALAGDATHIRVSKAAIGATQRVSIGLNKSMIVDLPIDVSEVIVSQPGVAGAIMRSKRRAILQGASVGGTNIFFLNGRGETIAVFDVSIGNDASNLATTIARILPGSRISVASFDDRVVLSGTAQSGDDIQKAIAIATQFTGSPESVTSVLTTNGAQQVMLKVTVAEVSRETIKQLGINLSATFNGGLTTGLISAPSTMANPLINATMSAGTVGISATLKALEQRGAVRTLAEPTLTAISGQEAEFLAGGEFPTLSGIEDGVRSFTYRKFGVELKFTPTVKSNGIIGLLVDTSVSELAEGGFETGAGVIPAINQRKAKTSVELPAGATLSIAGIIQDKVRQRFNSVPILGSIPILGALFRSRDFQRNQTELVILVTPYLAQVDAPVVLPTDSFHLPSDAEAVFLGHLQKMYGVGDNNGMRGGYQGSVGFVLD
jgi:pilus assembly protein CpaC